MSKAGRRRAAVMNFKRQFPDEEPTPAAIQSLVKGYAAKNTKTTKKNRKTTNATMTSTSGQKRQQRRGTPSQEKVAKRRSTAPVKRLLILVRRKDLGWPLLTWEEFLPFLQQHLDSDDFAIIKQFNDDATLLVWYGAYVEGVGSLLAQMANHHGIARLYQFDLFTALNNGHEVMVQEDVVNRYPGLQDILTKFFTVTIQKYTRNSAFKQMVDKIESGSRTEISTVKNSSPLLKDDGMSYTYATSSPKWTRLRYKKGTMCCVPLLAVTTDRVLMVPTKPMTPGTNTGTSCGIGIDVELRVCGANHMGNVPELDAALDCTDLYMADA